MRAGKRTIDIDIGFPIDRPEMEDDVLTTPIARDSECTVIPECVAVGEGLAYTRER